MVLKFTRTPLEMLPEIEGLLVKVEALASRMSSAFENTSLISRGTLFHPDMTANNMIASTLLYYPMRQMLSIE